MQVQASMRNYNHLGDDTFVAKKRGCNICCDEIRSVFNGIQINIFELYLAYLQHHRFPQLEH